jgi:myosin-3
MKCVLGNFVAIKILESINEVVEEIEEEYQVLRDLGSHPNIPDFHGLFLKQDPTTEDQLWIAMEVRLAEKRLLVYFMKLNS